MTITRSKVHEYLRMTLDYIVPGKVKVTMIPYVEDIISKFTKYIKSEKMVKTPAVQHLFQGNENVMALPEKTGGNIPHICCKVFVCDKMSTARYQHGSGFSNNSGQTPR